MSRNGLVRTSSAMALVATVAGLLATSAAQAATGGPGAAVAAQGQDTPWTPERMRVAKPMPLPRGSSVPAPGTHAPAPSEKSQIFKGFRPSQEPQPAPSAPYTGPAPQGAAQGAAPPPSKGTSGLPFTTTRVYPDAAVTTWPNRLAGKLFFHDQADGNDYQCSASIVGRRVVLTAGHCVYDGTFKKWMTNWAFVPAYNGNLASQPFGTWTVSMAGTTGPWMSSGGTVPNPSDFGVLVTKDQVIAGQTRKIGEYLGWLGAWTYSLVGTQVTELGYPGNLDSGLRMEVTLSQVVSGSSSTGMIGSAQSHGSSCGPWVMDFGVPAVGQAITNSPGVANLVVGVTSYGPKIDQGQQYQGSSILNNDYVLIKNTVCNAAAGNC